MVKSRFSIFQLQTRGSTSILCSKIILSIPAYAGSVSGKNSPMSPSANAPSIASIRACTATSASLCPRSPSRCGISTPHKMSLRPGTNRCTSYPCPILNNCLFLWLRVAHLDRLGKSDFKNLTRPLDIACGAVRDHFAGIFKFKIRTQTLQFVTWQFRESPFHQYQ